MGGNERSNIDVNSSKMASCSRFQKYVIELLMNRLGLLNILNNKVFNQLFIDSSKTVLTAKKPLGSSGIYLWASVLHQK